MYGRGGGNKIPSRKREKSWLGIHHTMGAGRGRGREEGEICEFQMSQGQLVLHIPTGLSSLQAT